MTKDEAFACIELLNHLKDNTSQLSVTPDENPSKFLHLNHSTLNWIKYNFFKSQIRSIQDMIGLDDLTVFLTDLETYEY